MLTKVINLVIAVIVFLIIIYFGMKVFSLFDQNNKLEKMKEQLEHTSDVILKFNEMDSCTNGICEQKVEFFPEPRWFLRTFPNYDFPNGQCRGSISCVCVCNRKECDNNFISCQGFLFDVKVQGSYSESDVIVEAGGAASVFETTSDEIIEFKNAVTELQLIKDGNLVRIREVK